MPISYLQRHIANPNTFNWVLEEFMGINIINVPLGVIIFGMDTTLKIEHFEMCF